MSENTLPPAKHQCGTCGAVFDSLEALHEHERQHHGEHASGEPPKSDTRRTSSHAGSNVSSDKEGKPVAKKSPSTGEPISEPPDHEQGLPPAKE